MNQARRTLSSLLPFLLVVGDALAHGGQYYGPGNVVPPSPGSGTSGGSSSGGGSATSDSTSGSGPANAGATVPGSSPTTGSSANPPGGGGAGVAAAPAIRGAPLDSDLTRWEFWWEFGKAPYMRLRDVLQSRHDIPADDAFLNPRHAARLRDVALPRDSDIGAVAEFLAALLTDATDRDTVSSCLVALAKIGRDGNGWTLRERVTPFLRSNDQELRETAAVALGIAGIVDDATIDLLTALLRDDEVGRAASGDHAVNERTRAFAAFALGLLLRRATEPAPAHRIAHVLCERVEDAAHQGRELLVATIEALSLYPRRSAEDTANADRARIVAALTRYYDENLGPGDQLIQAHVPPALARCLPPTSADARRWFERLCDELDGDLDHEARTRKTSPYVAQSCALALGMLAPQWNAGDKGAERAGAILLQVARAHRDPQTRRFAFQAIGRMGGDAARHALLSEFAGASKALEQPWIAMALGVLEAKAGARARADHASHEVPKEIVGTLRGALRGARNPSAQASLALALGLCRADAAADDLRALLCEKAHDDDLAGYIAIALGLMADSSSAGPVRDLLNASGRRPLVVMHTAQALGLLGDQTVVDDLCRALDGGDQGLVRLSAIAGALGQIGDRRAIPPLLGMARNQDLTTLTRAFAVVALGGICDKDPLPWNAVYSSECNYRASTSTLTDGATGILDIL
ncbi:MAG: hypothetical protein U1E73_14035 [Planctomycetota bacterium]